MFKQCARASASLLALAAITPAFAQSTGSQQFDQQQIVVTGTHGQQNVSGIAVSDTPKARQVLTQDFIKHQRPGQSVDEIINMMPGVSFQNNDPYGSSGGTLTIHGFDASRISQTFDGIPLNDTGNYALYSNQQLDPELITQVNVSLGSTDIDSPTASATGSTVNYTTRNPTEDFHANLLGSFGQWDYYRMFGVIDTGDFTPFGTRAWVAASHTENRNPYYEPSKINKTQFNAKVYQPIGDNGDFISVAGHANFNRNNNFSSVYLRTDTTQLSEDKNGNITSTPRLVGSGSSNRYPDSKDERDYTNNFGPCQTTVATAGKADAANSCGTLYDQAYNPSNTWNIRINSRFTLAPGLVLTVDPSYQFTKANGGAPVVTATEGFYKLKNGQQIYGYIGGKPYFGGVDLNGDGDTLDTVSTYAESTTQTNRFGVIANLQYEINRNNTIRINYTWDHGRHQQTGEETTLMQNGDASHVFPNDYALVDASGQPIQKRNRLSYAILNQVAGEYRGKFFDDRLSIDAGVRAPFFTRDLNNLCVTETGGNGFVDCFNDPTSQAAFLAQNTAYTPPQKRNIHYSKVLPSAGFTFSLMPKVSLFASYSKGLQVPGTDNLYNAFSFAADSDAAHPKAETSDNFVAGARYKSGKVQAELSGWYTNFKNRLASSYDPETATTIYRNLGTVHKYGFDGSIAYQPIQHLTLYAFGSYLKSKILDNVQIGGGDYDCSNASMSNTSDLQNCAFTKGKRESGSPTYTFGGRAQGNFGPLELGLQAKRTGPRYLNDQNLPVIQCLGTFNGAVCGSSSSVPKPLQYQVYGAKAPAYTVVDLDARLSLGFLGFNERTFLQLNVTNLFDKFYVGGIGGNLSNTKIANGYIGSPRTVSGTISFGF